MTDTRAGFVALIGEPNAGKSTLMNRIVGAKVSIVTHKVQTTRARIRGIAMEGDSQIVFVDTPGLFRTRRNLDRAMVAAAWAGAGDADITVLLVEAHRGMSPGVRMILEELGNKVGKNTKVALAINKIDKVEASRLLALTQELSNAYPFEKVFMISAEKGHGVKDLTTYLAETLPLSPWLYPEDQIADVPMRMIAAETTREKLMLRLHQELPYFLTVETENWEQKKDGSVRIDQVIYVTREGHKGIAVGPKGETIKAVSMASREELKELVGAEVHLFLQVKVRPKWESEAERFTEMGLDFKDTKD
ncbi:MULTISPECIES: GTPase Era [Rhodobacterales]|uniref:GTPase Era n=1 Tax=Roseobacter sp. N2S TaxID=2663844 RepID=UPI002860EFA1|nr:MULTISPECIES: GTPase Era [Rhodobacterales]MDR6267235.1 GTP-binding protein Era [Roseobacter sp. N2S]